MKDIEWKSLLGRNPRRLVLPVAGALILIVAVLFGLLPVLNNIKAKKQSIEINEALLKELASLSKRYREIMDRGVEEIEQLAICSNPLWHFHACNLASDIHVEKVSAMLAVDL